MPPRSRHLYLNDIIEAIDRINHVLKNATLDSFEADWQKQWMVERGIEIISEISRRLSNELKARHPAIPWLKVAGIGNVLRHGYESVSAPLMWKLVKEDLPLLDQVCREELGQSSFCFSSFDGRFRPHPLNLSAMPLCQFWWYPFATALACTTATPGRSVSMTAPAASSQED
jgi:uncharacterized protein with HEPN domain